MAEDFMPLLGWDYVELWVGNAKQAAYFYEHAMGFTRTAYAGPETGVYRSVRGGGWAEGRQISRNIL